MYTIGKLWGGMREEGKGWDGEDAGGGERERERDGPGVQALALLVLCLFFAVPLFLFHLSPHHARLFFARWLFVALPHLDGSPRANVTVMVVVPSDGCEKKIKGEIRRL
jgi:hypothetical protein